MKQKTNRLHFSTRTLAMVLSIVMLIGSIATGSMLNTFAAYLKDAAANSDAVSQAASEGSDIALNAIPSEDAAQADNEEEKPDLSGFEENEIVRGMKEDLAVTGAGIDLANTGATYYIWKAEDGGGSSSQYTCLGASPQNLTATAGKNYYIAISTSASSVTSGSVRLTGADFTDVSVSGQGVQQFDGNAYQSYRISLSSATTLSISYTSGTKIKVTGGGSSSSSCTTDHRMIITGSKQLTNTDNWQNTWSGAGTRNQMTYNSSVGMYEIKYTNIAANSSSSDHFRFRILDLTTKGDPDTDWETDKGYDQGSGAISDASNLLQYSAKGNDNTFEFSLSAKANITIYLDDSKLKTNSAIHVIITPSVSTVTAGTQTGGTVKVNNASSASNITYGGSVTLTATPSDNYVFSKWNNNTYLTYANQNAASTTATVTGTTTVNATFTKASFSVTRGTGAGDTGAFTITTPSSTQTKQWGTSVSVTAKTTDDLHYIDYLYYLNDDSGAEQVISGGAAAGAGTTATLSGSFTMPTNNVTVYAHTHKRQSYAVNYAVSTDSGSAGHGYVNAGMQYSSSSTNVKKTITSGDSVLQNEKVNIGARAEAGYRFVGWYPNADGSGTVISTDKDVTVTVDAAKNYYAKFVSLTATAGVRIYVPYAQRDEKVWIWGTTSPDTGTSGTYTDRPKASAAGTAVDLNGSTFYLFDYPNSSSVYFRLGDNEDQPKYTTGTYVADDNTVSGNSGVPTFDIYYPVKFVVTNPDLAGSATYAPLFGKKSTSTTFHHQPSDTSNNKTSVTTTGFTSDDTNYKTTSTSRSKTMPSSGATTPVYTVTFVPKDYYKVNFSAGAGGTIKASTGTSYAAANDIKTGTSVKEGTAITIVATPASGYEVAGWDNGGGTVSTGTNTNDTCKFTDAQFTSEKTVRVYFKKTKGTANTSTYLGYVSTATSTTNCNPYDMTIVQTYVKNGRVYGYIDSPDTSKAYYVAAYDVYPSTDDGRKEYYTKQLYWGDGSLNGETQFTDDIENVELKWYNAWDKDCHYIRFTMTSDVIGLMIDLGPDDGSGNARPDKDGNKYKIIPIYNNDVSKVTVYAKDATFRNDSIYDYMPGIADTVITNPTGGGVTKISSQTEFNTAVAEKGKKITVTTTIASGANNRDRFYVKGFSFNGVTPELYTENSTGEYTCTYTIPADFEDDYLEITPVYFMRDSYLNTAANNATAMTFYIENYDQAFQDTGWGNTLSVYPFYSTASNPVYSKANVFGGYPGMPVINYGGRRFVQIPTTYKLAVASQTKENDEVVTKDAAGTAATIKGVTLSNYYWDKVHRDYCQEVDEHLQTYDYDDFYKIYHETTKGHEVNEKEGTADQITFAFKYRTEIDNFGATNRITAGNTLPATITTSSFTNGWEQLLDYHDRPINIFGKILSNAEQTNDPIYVVSNGYEYTHAGNYATTYTAYYNDNGTYRQISTITPSALIISDQDDIADYPDAPQVTGGPALLQIDDQTEEYEALMNYSDRPVMITYEEAIRNSSTSGTGKYYHSALGEIATRSDGRWFYSYMNEAISANLRIDYGDEDYGDDLSSWSHDTFKSGTNTGTVTGATVHFTNDGTTPTDGGYDLTDYHDTADWTALDPTNNIIYSNFNHYYKFGATEGAGYIFMGWYMERDDIQTAVTPDNVKQLTGESQMTSNATFVARYVKNPAGHLTINHEMDEGSTGTGTTYIKVEKSTDGSSWTNVTDFVRQDSYSINDTDIMSYNSGYLLRVTLKTIVEADTSFERFSAATGENDKSSEYFSSDVTTTTTTNTNDTTTTSFVIPVDDLFELVDGFPQQKVYYDTFTYYSHTVKKPELTINHHIDPTSDATATGNTYLKVEITDAGKSTVYNTYGGSETDGYKENGDIVIPSQYFNTTGGYYLKIYLKTDMLDFTQFEQFSVLGNILRNAAGEQGQQVTVSDANDKRTKLATVIFPASALFENGEPTTTELPFLSKLIVPDYKYEFTYTVPSYIDKDQTISYTAKDSFADEELREYMTLTNGDLAFQSDSKKKTFVCSKAPYEDNFQKTIDFYNQFDTTAREYYGPDYTLTFSLRVSEAQQQTLDVRMKFPYQTQADAHRFEYQVTDGKVLAVESNEQLITGVYGRDWITLNGVRNKTVSGTPQFITAPLIIYNDNGTAADTTDDYNQYFKYWLVESVGTAKNVQREYTRCYDYEFNLSVYQDSIITPVYSTEEEKNSEDFGSRGMPNPPTTYDGYSRFDPDVNRTRYSVAANGVSISFIENSRNQYNNGGAPSSYDTDPGKTNYTGAADRVYSDFLMTFDVDPTVKLNKSTANTMQAGLIIQPVAYLEKNAAGEYVVADDAYYSSTDKYTSRALTPAQIKAHLEGSATRSGLLRSKFDVTELDNKNRVQYYYSFDNAAPKSDDDANADADGIIRVGDTYRNQRIVYLAFAYIGTGTANADILQNVTVSAQPIYFTFYGDATIEPGYYIRNTSGS